MLLSFNTMLDNAFRIRSLQCAWCHFLFGTSPPKRYCACRAFGALPPKTSRCRPRLLCDFPPCSPQHAAVDLMISVFARAPWQSFTWFIPSSHAFCDSHFPWCFLSHVRSRPPVDLMMRTYASFYCLFSLMHCCV